MNLSKRLLQQIARIEASKYRVKVLWRLQTEKQKWVFGVATMAIAGLVLAKGKKFAIPGIIYLREMLSVFVVVSKFIASSGPQINADEK